MTSPAETSATLAAVQARRGRTGLAWSGTTAPSGGAESVQAASGRLGRIGGEDRLLGDALRARATTLLAADAPPDSARHDPGPAAVAAALWARFLKFDAADPHWPDRDRCVFSPGHGAALHAAVLELTGHPGAAKVPDVAAGASGPAAMLAQGLAAAVGMALAERFLAARFGRSLVDHRTWVIASDGDLMQGVSHEAASLAGHLKLDRLTVLWEARAAGDGDSAGSEDTLRRFAAYGWATRAVEAHDHVAIAAALGMAMRSRKPTLVACRATAATAPQPATTVLPVAAASWLAAGRRGAAARRSWLKRLAHHPRRSEFERVTAGLLPPSLSEVLDGLKSAFATWRGAMTTREASERVLAALAAVLPELVGGAADPARTAPPGAGAQTGGFAARFLHFGIREHGMAAAMIGMAAHRGVLPYGGTACALSESVRPALRLAAVMKSRLVHVLTHDPAGMPAARPIEHLASLRAVPNLHVLRPADAVETAECWELALRRQDGPSLLVLGREQAPILRDRARANRCAEGGYVLAEADGPRRATLIATGSEVALALAARARLAAERIAVAVVSLPCWDLFARAGAAHHARVLGEVMRFGVEAGIGFGWERWLGPDGVFIGCEDLSAAPDLTPEAIAATVRRCLAA